VLASEQYRRVIAGNSDPARKEVIFLTGVPGAGKTSSVVYENKIRDSVCAIYEGQLSKPEPNIAKMQQALDAGMDVRIVAVHANSENALNNTLGRFHENGRGASMNVMAEIQGGLPDGLGKVHRHFGERVALEIVDVRDRDHAKVSNGWNNLEILKSEGSHENIKRRLETELERQRPNISDAAYQHARGMSPGNYGLAWGYGGKLQEDASRRELSQENSEKGLLAPRHDLNKNQAQIHVAATENVAANLEALKKNPALAGKSAEALEKLAYCRGVLQENIRQEPQAAQDVALAKFDKAAENPEFLQRLEQSEKISSPEPHHEQGQNQVRNRDEHGLKR
jgi:hypothetical protein